jgi:hypothetical protein
MRDDIQIKMFFAFDEELTSVKVLDINQSSWHLASKSLIAMDVASHVRGIAKIESVSMQNGKLVVEFGSNRGLGPLRQLTENAEAQMYELALAMEELRDLGMSGAFADLSNLRMDAFGNVFISWLSPDCWKHRSVREDLNDLASLFEDIAPARVGVVQLVEDMRMGVGALDHEFFIYQRTAREARRISLTQKTGGRSLVARRWLSDFVASVTGSPKGHDTAKALFDAGTGDTRADAVACAAVACSVFAGDCHRVKDLCYWCSMGSVSMGDLLDAVCRCLPSCCGLWSVGTGK